MMSRKFGCCAVMKYSETEVKGLWQFVFCLKNALEHALQFICIKERKKQSSDKVYTSNKTIQGPLLCLYVVLTLKAPSKICSRRHSNFFIIIIFQGKQVLTFLVNHLPT